MSLKNNDEMLYFAASIRGIVNSARLIVFSLIIQKVLKIDRKYNQKAFEENCK